MNHRNSKSIFHGITFKASKSSYTFSNMRNSRAQKNEHQYKEHVAGYRSAISQVRQKTKTEPHQQYQPGTYLIIYVVYSLSTVQQHCKVLGKHRKSCFLYVNGLNGRKRVKYLEIRVSLDGVHYMMTRLCISTPELTFKYSTVVAA